MVIVMRYTAIACLFPGQRFIFQRTGGYADAAAHTALFNDNGLSGNQSSDFRQLANSTVYLGPNRNPFNIKVAVDVILQLFAKDLNFISITSAKSHFFTRRNGWHIRRLQIHQTGKGGVQRDRIDRLLFTFYGWYCLKPCFYDTVQRHRQ